MNGAIRTLFLIVLLGIWATFAVAQDQGDLAKSILDVTKIDPSSLSVLLLIAVLAIFVEIGLSVLYNWRIWIENFDGIGVKTIINFSVSLVFVTQMNLQGVRETLEAFADKEIIPDLGLLDHAITAAIIAGGSSTVFQLFEKLGIRNPLPRQAIKEEVRKRGRLSVQIVSDKRDISKPVTIWLNAAIIGMVPAGATAYAPGWIRKGRIVPSGEKLDVKLTATGKDGQPLSQNQVVTLSEGASYPLTFIL